MNYKFLKCRKTTLFTQLNFPKQILKQSFTEVEPYLTRTCAVDHSSLLKVSLMFQYDLSKIKSMFKITDKHSTETTQSRPFWRKLFQSKIISLHTLKSGVQRWLLQYDPFCAYQNQITGNAKLNLCSEHTPTENYHLRILMKK